MDHISDTRDSNDLSTLSTEAITKFGTLATLDFMPLQKQQDIAW